jgi:hypothetical protein
MITIEKNPKQEKLINLQSNLKIELMQIFVEEMKYKLDVINFYKNSESFNYIESISKLPQF